ncbi:hypothetical protein SADUNF_Sadunf12G0104200 [Salix dunnii]|uniref:Dihydrodipicolinate reductase C-terminal domain-containing protein n=1 Tax=Salix dunnii TaxID=1413687 RepID=A0A835JJE1_9ROSI|nr:hypothetical protein SADUNF_Sadunf12G0104200 [Salix dunnii]
MKTAFIRNQSFCITHYLLNVFDTQDFSSMDAVQFLKSLSNMGQICNKEGICTDIVARGQVLRQDGDRSMVLPGRPYSTAIDFSGPGEVYSIKHDIADVKCLMPGLILAIRKVIRLKVNQSINIQSFLL